MGKKWYQWLVGGLLGLSFVAVAPHAVSAATTQQAVPLRVSTVRNQYQATQATQYYDLEMQPKQKTTLKLKLGNVGDKAIKINVQVAAAQTGDNAQIDYSGTNKTYDASMTYPLTTLIGIPKAYKTITIPAGKTAVYHFPLTMPKQRIKGYVLGQINIKQAKVQQAKGTISNTYSYGVGVRISNGVSTLPNLTMPGQATVKRADSQTSVLATIRNAKGSAVRNGKLNASVTKRGQNRVLKSIAYNDSTVAPTSRFTLRVPWAGSIAPGDYTLHVVYKSTDPSFDATKTWRFTKNFHVSTVQAAQLTMASYHVPWWIYVILAVILILLILIIWLLLKRRKKEAQASDD